MRMQWWQSTVCWRNISSTIALRFAKSSSESVVMTMPSAALTAQACFSLSSPLTLTMHNLHAALGLSPS